MTSALSQVMVTVSPPVSPSVVARILMIQKPSVTSGTLVSQNFRSLLISDDPRKNTAEPKGPAGTDDVFLSSQTLAGQSLFDWIRNRIVWRACA